MLLLIFPHLLFVIDETCVLFVIDETGVLFVIDKTGGLLFPLNMFLTSVFTGSLCAACGDIHLILKEADEQHSHLHFHLCCIPPYLLSTPINKSTNPSFAGVAKSQRCKYGQLLLICDQSSTLYIPVTFCKHILTQMTLLYCLSTLSIIMFTGIDWKVSTSLFSTRTLTVWYGSCSPSASAT